MPPRHNNLPSNPHFLSEFFKNKFVRVPIIIAFWGLAIIILYLAFKAMFGFNVKLFGIETSPQKPPTDTLYKNTYDTVFYTKYDTVYISGTSQSKSVSTKNNVKDGSKYNFNAPITGPSQFGDNNTQNNNFGNPERHITDKDMNDLIKLNTYNSPVEIRYYTNTMEASNLAAEMIAWYEKNNIKVTSRPSFALRPEGFPKDRDFQYFANDSIFQITIWPQLPDKK